MPGILISSTLAALRSQGQSGGQLPPSLGSSEEQGGRAGQEVGGRAASLPGPSCRGPAVVRPPSSSLLTHLNLSLWLKPPMAPQCSTKWPNPGACAGRSGSLPFLPLPFLCTSLSLARGGCPPQPWAPVHPVWTVLLLLLPWMTLLDFDSGGGEGAPGTCPSPGSPLSEVS